MTRTYPLPNGAILQLHIFDEKYGEVCPSLMELYERKAKGDGWAVDQSEVPAEVVESKPAKGYFDHMLNSALIKETAKNG